MVKLIANGTESYNLVDTLLGFPSFFFTSGGTVEDATSTGFTLKAGSVSIPGFPVI